MNRSSVPCAVCQVRPVTFFKRVCNNCGLEIAAVAAGKYPAHIAANRIERVTEAILFLDFKPEMCSTNEVAEAVSKALCDGWL